jgi:hypothetical protein
LPKGSQLVTLEDAGAYITELPKADQQLDESQTAIECLLLVVKLEGPTMLARIGVIEPPPRSRVQSRPQRPSLGQAQAGAGSVKGETGGACSTLYCGGTFAPWGCCDFG